MTNKELYKRLKKDIESSSRIMLKVSEPLKDAKDPLFSFVNFGKKIVCLYDTQLQPLIDFMEERAKVRASQRV
jgi:hypothetical protein